MFHISTYYIDIDTEEHIFYLNNSEETRNTQDFNEKIRSKSRRYKYCKLQ